MFNKALTFYIKEELCLLYKKDDMNYIFRCLDNIENIYIPEWIVNIYWYDDELNFTTLLEALYIIEEILKENKDIC